MQIVDHYDFPHRLVRLNIGVSVAHLTQLVCSVYNWLEFAREELRLTLGVHLLN